MNNCLATGHDQTPRVNRAPEAINYGVNVIRSVIATVALLAVLVVAFVLAMA